MRSHVTIALLAALIAACGADESGSAMVPVDTGATADAAADVGTADTGVYDTVPDACIVDPASDRDEDGLLDIIEDENRNCRRDAGETDPDHADTDGDGLLDGDEDVDRNGRWDFERGELDPRTRDTDEDGVLDGDELVSAVCDAALLSDNLPRRRTLGTHEVFVPRGAEDAYAPSATEMLILGDGAVSLVALSDEPAPKLLRVPATMRIAAAAGGDGGWLARVDGNDAVISPLLQLVTAFGVISDVSPTDLAMTTSTDLQVEFARDGAGSAWVFSSVDGTGQSADSWLAEARAAAVRPAGGGRVLPRCETLAVPPVPTRSTVVLVVAGSDVGLQGFERVVGLVEALMDARAGQGLPTELRIVRGDGHVDGHAGALVGGGPLTTAAAARLSLSGLVPQSVDQRVWLNAVAALQSMEPPARDERRTVVIVLPREDSEFRTGMIDGLEGHPYGDPMGDGDGRDSLTAFYAEAIGSLSDEFVAIRSGGCDQPPPLSALDMTGELSGGYFDACSDAGLALADPGLMRAAGGTPAARVSAPVVPGTIRVIGEDGEVATAAATRGGTVLLPSVGTLDVAAGYLYPEADSAP